jgi:fermentation-respiration switch protein FrsA (DUF1100 family)
MSIIDRFVFFPDRQLAGSPADVGLRYEDAWFLAADNVQLHGWWVPGDRAETVLWFHGNAGNISHRLEQLKLLHDAVGPSVLLVGYRGYGQSGGSPSEGGLYADARGALAYVRSRSEVDRERVVYFGQSLGSAVAIELATRRSPRGLILETPFTSIQEMAGGILPAPLFHLVPRRFDNLDQIPKIRCPMLFIHGDRDEVVPYEQGRRLFEAACGPKKFLTIAGARHNDIFVVGANRYFDAIREFLDSLGSISS